MIVVSGTLTVDPANHDAAVEAMNKLVPATLAEEGNVTYGFWASLTTPGEFRVFEEWKDEAALGTHFAEPHMAEFMGALGGLGVTGSSIQKYEVSGTSPLM